MLINSDGMRVTAPVFAAMTWSSDVVTPGTT
jgi:hypothetical protein